MFLIKTNDTKVANCFNLEIPAIFLTICPFRLILFFTKIADFKYHITEDAKKKNVFTMGLKRIVLDVKTFE